MATPVLDFEKPLVELEQRIDDLKRVADDGALDGAARVPLQQFADGDGAEATRAAGVRVAHGVGALAPGESDLGRVDDDDEVTRVDMRRELRLMLAAQEVRDLDGQAAQDHVLGINDVPVAGDFARLWGVRGHNPTSIRFGN